VQACREDHAPVAVTGALQRVYIDIFDAPSPESKKRSNGRWQRAAWDYIRRAEALGLSVWVSG
jgi:hypothetical protein